MNKKTKSPLKETPLRYPGQSCDDEIEKILDSKAMPLMALLIIYLLISIYAWCSWIFNLPRLETAIINSVFTVGLFIYFIRYIRKVKKKISALKLGRDGEKIVGQLLDKLKNKDVRIFHDIKQDEDYNIDHVIVSMRGIFVIETKTYSKPEDKKDSKIIFDGEKILVNGVQTTRNPVNQVDASSKWLAKLLEDTTGKKFAVKPVIVFPEWYVDTTPAGKQSHIWVLNTKALIKYINNENINLTKEDVMLISNRLSIYIRNKNYYE